MVIIRRRDAKRWKNDYLVKGVSLPPLAYNFRIEEVFNKKLPIAYKNERMFNKMTTETQNTEQKDNWRLQKIELEFQRWGENKDKYIGKIVFENGEFESFSFNIKPEMAQPYIELMSSDIVKCAESLGSRLIDSLGIKKSNND